MFVTEPGGGLKVAGQVAGKSFRPKYCHPKTWVKWPEIMLSHVTWILSGEVHRETKFFLLKLITAVCEICLVQTIMRQNRTNECVTIIPHSLSDDETKQVGYYV